MHFGTPACASHSQEERRGENFMPAMYITYRKKERTPTCSLPEKQMGLFLSLGLPPLFTHTLFPTLYLVAHPFQSAHMRHTHTQNLGSGDSDSGARPAISSRPVEERKPLPVPACHLPHAHAHCHACTCLGLPSPFCRRGRARGCSLGGK